MLNDGEAPERLAAGRGTRGARYDRCATRCLPGYRGRSRLNGRTVGALEGWGAYCNSRLRRDAA
jgi:hypothetical protein